MKRIALRKIQNLILRLVVALGLVISIIGFQNLIASDGSGNTAIQLADSGGTASQFAKAIFKKGGTASQSI